MSGPHASTLLALPEEFSYSALTRAGETVLDSGEPCSPVYSEFTGPTFSADGRVLYVNIQDPGLTLAITGPWEKYLG